MAGCTADNNSCKVSLGETEDTALKVRFKPQGGGSVCREVVQAMLLYGSEMWVLSEATKRKSEGTHTWFLR